jgi:hypothetical protein
MANDIADHLAYAEFFLGAEDVERPRLWIC